jgi:hypothetical protein
MTDAKLSKRARDLLERVRNGAFYRPWSPDLPKAMKELEDAGLVATTGRVVVIELCYVPAEGYTPYVPEKFEARK